jgi:hypothetical protein
MEGKEEESYMDPKPPFEPLKARAYHINQAAIDVCNAMEQAPAETIVALAGYVEGQKKMLEERDKMIASLQNIVPTDGRPVYTLQEFGDVMRKVTQVEGVSLNEKQKGFFRELIASLTKCISDKGVWKE